MSPPVPGPLTFVTRWLHNYITFALHRGFYQHGTPFVIVPIRVS